MQCLEWCDDVDNGEVNVHFFEFRVYVKGKKKYITP